jgi:hypothetical protein
MAILPDDIGSQHGRRHRSLAIQSRVYSIAGCSSGSIVKRHDGA